jgi:hypothetical protein
MIEAHHRFLMQFLHSKTHISSGGLGERSMAYDHFDEGFDSLLASNRLEREVAEEGS